MMEQYGLRRDLIFVDNETWTTCKRWSRATSMSASQPGDTVVFWQDRFSRNFEEGVAIQKDLDYLAYWGAGYCSPCRRR